MIEFPFHTTALKVEQPLGLYYVAVLPAELLLNVCFSDRLKAHREEGETYVLGGTQRAIDDKMLLASCFGPLRPFNLAHPWNVKDLRVVFGSAGA